MKDTAGRLLRSTGAATLSQVWRYLVAFGARVLLRRLLLQAAWGLWHWAVDAVLALLAQVRDLGLPAQVVRDRCRPFGNFLAVELVWGGLLAILLAVFAPRLAGLYEGGGEVVVPALRFLALFFLLEGLARVPLTWFEAELALDRTLVPEITRNTLWAGLSIGLAFAGWGVWSLLVAHTVATGVFAAQLWWRALPVGGGGLRLHWEPGYTLPMVRRGLPLMAIALLFLALMSVGFLILGARFPENVVAQFGASLELAFLTARVLELPLRRPLYPALVGYLDAPRRFLETYRLATVLLLAVEVPAALFLWANAELVLTLYAGGAYVEAAPYLRVMAFVLIVQPFARAAEDVLLARNEERVLIFGTGLNFVALVGLGLALTAWMGPVGMAWAHLVVPGELVLAWAVRRVSPAGFLRLLKDMALLYLVPLPLFAAALVVTPEASWTRFGLTLVAAAVAAGVFVWRFGRGFVAFFRGEGLDEVVSGPGAGAGGPPV